MSLRVARLCGRIELQLDVRFAGRVRVVMDHRAQNQLVAEIAEARQRRFDHDRFADLESGFTGAELVLPRGGYSDDAVPSQTIRRGKFGVDMSLSIRSKRRVPESAREKILSQTFERRRPALGVANQVA